MKQERPNIILIVFDSSRAQNFSVYGYPRNTTPHLKKIAKECVTYKNAISTAPSTIPSHTSLFTGTNVSTHQLFDKKELSSSFYTLAEVLEEIGYATYGICYQDDVSPATGLTRGFQKFDQYDEPNMIKKIARKVIGTKASLPSGIDKAITATHGINQPNNKLIKLIKNSNGYKAVKWNVTKYFDMGANASVQKVKHFVSSISNYKPFFVFLHFDEAHLPYRAPVPFLNMFMNNNVKVKKPWLVNQDRNKFFLNEVYMDENDFEYLRVFYDGANAYLDCKTYELYRFFKANNLWNNTMFIVLGDHGDNIGEHGLMSHKWCLYDTVIKVPFIIKYPKSVSVKGEIDTIVQQTDLFPTIIDLLGLQNHEVVSQLEGNSLLSSNIVDRDSRYAISEYIEPFGLGMLHLKNRLRKYDRTILSIRSLTHKYIWMSDGTEEFYDLVDDPNETINLINSYSAELEKLKQVMKNHFPKFEKACDNH